MDESNSTFETAEHSFCSTIISVTSESELLVAGKLHSDIIKLKDCYIKLLNKYDPNKTSDSCVDLLTREQMVSAITKYISSRRSL